MDRRDALHLESVKDNPNVQHTSKFSCIWQYANMRNSSTRKLKQSRVGV
jgi:hypothetical protein